MMRNFILTCAVATFLQFSGWSQISNLSELAQGRMEMFSPIFELNENVYGYLAIYRMEKISKEKEKYEYIVFDKNLNKVANGEFTDAVYRRTNYDFLTPEKIDDKIIITKGSKNIAKDYSMFTTNWILDVGKNEISNSFYYENGRFIEGARSVKKILKNQREAASYEYPIAMKDGFLMWSILKQKQGRKFINTIKGYDTNKREKWSFDFNPNGHKENAIFIDANEQSVLFEFVNVKDKSITLKEIDPSTGKLRYSYLLENRDSDYNHVAFIKKNGDHTVITGKTSPYKRSGYDIEKANGLFRIVLDKQGKEISKKYVSWKEAGRFMEISKKGKVENGYKLVAKDYFILKDGSVSILTEKLKDNYNLFWGTNVVKTTDLVLMRFDPEFNLIDIKLLEKDKTKWANSDYLYSQSVDDGEGVVFFYRDYKKDEETRKKSWMLSMVSMLGGQFKHDQIPMSSEEHFLLPYIAKEKYILLREFNKDEDYDQIRLEKLNF